MRWRSPLRGPWFTSVLAAALLCLLPVVVLTGLLSYVAYGVDARPGDVGLLHLPRFDWPTEPSWLYRINQGLHVTLGLVLVPLVGAKLWSVIPRLFVWPPATSLRQGLERLTLLMLVGGVLFEIATGILNIQYDYVFGFSFYTAHYLGAWVFIAGFVAHLVLKVPIMATALRTRSLRQELRTPLSATTPEERRPEDVDSLVPVDPDPPTISRRGALAVVGGGSLLVLALTAGQSIGGTARQLALLLPRGRDVGDGPNGFPVNKTAVAAHLDPRQLGQGWSLTVTGARTVVLDRSQLLDLPQHTAGLPISCVEGWSTGAQEWSGVRLRDLAALAGSPRPDGVEVRSLQPSGAFRSARLHGGQVQDPDSLLALRVNGVDLSPDHGFPARVIVPAAPGVLNTKWVATLDFGAVT